MFYLLLCEAKLVNFKLSDEAGQVIRSYVNEVSKVMDELEFEVDEQLKRNMLFNLEHHLRSACFKRSWKRGAVSVEREDARHVMTKFFSPEKLVKEILLNPKIFPFLEQLRIKRLKEIKTKLRRISKPWLLDAGCGWDRTLFEFERHGVKGEFVGVDIDRALVKYGNSVGSRSTG